MLNKFCILLLATAVAAEIYLDERFKDGEAFKDVWVQSKHDGKDYGVFKLTAGKFFGNSQADKGIQTSQDARFYEFSRKLDKSFSNDGKDLVLQFTVKHEQKIDCGGGYIKLMSKDVDLSDFHGETPYFVMFGPDICGYSTKKVHVILNYKGKNHQFKQEIACKDDEYTHLYTLIISSDNTFRVLIDNEEVKKGDLTTDFDMLPPKMIKDPNDKKPADWEDKEYINDPEDKKPDDHDKPEHIPDPDAKKPEDWDDEMDGEWEPPKITNPEYKGEWTPKQIKNPKYQGEWVQKEMANPEYVEDKTMYKFDGIGAVGFDLWQVKSGTIFDNILITDDVEEAKRIGEETFGKTQEPEKKMREEQQDEERKKEEAEEKERKEKEEAEKKDKKEDEKEEEKEVKEDEDKETKERDEL